jgi:hypothetical protein
MVKRECCKFFKEQKKLMDLRVKIMDRVGANRPRDVVMMSQIMNEQSPWILQLLNKDYCPCQDHPEPELFSKWIGRIVRVKESGKELSFIEAIDLGSDILENYNEEIENG